MAKSSHLWFSQPHESEKNDYHTDSYRQTSDSAKVEKTDHNPASRETEIKINTSTKK